MFFYSPSAFNRLALTVLLSLACLASHPLAADAEEVLVPGLKTESQCTTQAMTAAACAAHNYNILNHRLNYANDSDEGYILPSGVFPVPMLAIGKDASLKGAGAGVTTLKFTPVSGHSGDDSVIHVASTLNRRISVSLSGLTLDGGGTVDGLQIKDSENARFSELSIANAKYGLIAIENNVRLYIDTVAITTPLGNGSSLLGGVVIGKFASQPDNTQSNIDIHLTNISVAGDFDPEHGDTDAVCDSGVTIRSGTSGVYANRISVARCDYGFIVEKISGPYPWVVPEWIFCADCIADTSRKTGWRIQDARGLSLNGSWSGTSGEFGVELVNVRSATLQGLKVYNNGFDGIHIGENSKEVVVQGNLIDRNGTTSGTHHGIYTAGHQIITRNNIISNASDVVVEGTANALTCGIKIGGGSVQGASTNDNIIQNATTAVCP